ncbi:hypothetical protein OSB04_010304 [Centaurea solstitialis]|uniref:EngB-type G domain-containing protein n=1 Tax=Centaurea solstitialis TaxID=347529 RepID=A0AA38T7A5_9ASTR|nr:hypothetical protein OSB04_010304 [Centaurea solstitialis]
MAFLTHFPIAPIHHHSSSLFTRFFLSPKPKTLFILSALSSPESIAISHFSSTSTITPSSSSSSQEISLPEETPLLIAREKLFIPPETEISSDKPPRILRGSNIVLSNVETEACPADGWPEFALVGRSNVGKSSLLNSIVKRKKLALTSKKPGASRLRPLGINSEEHALAVGKTQCINHFRINDSWYLVDLPGYGYASAPHELKTDWNKFTKDYFLNRSTLVSVFLLIDASIPAKKIDLEYASWLGQNQVPMTIIFTKCDKRKKKKNGGKHPEENVQDFQELISEYFEAVPPWIMTSSVTNQGRDEILLHMSQLRNYWLKH